MIDIVGVLERLPHRFPFVMIDKVLSYMDGEITCLKNVTYNEPYFVGHFPGRPIMPAVLQLEAMAQAAALGYAEGNGALRDKVFLFTSVREAKFKKQVVPGDALLIKAKIIRPGTRFSVYDCECSVNGALVSQASIMAAVG